MHALEEDRQEVVQWNQEGVSPLSGEVRCESRVLLRTGNEWQDEPISPFSLTLQLQCLLLEELLSLLQVTFLEKQINRIRISEGCRVSGHTFLKLGYLDGVDDVVSVQAGSQLVDCGSVNVLQPREQSSVQVEPVILQTKEVKALDKLLQLVNDLIYLQTEHPKNWSILYMNQFLGTRQMIWNICYIMLTFGQCFYCFYF